MDSTDKNKSGSSHADGSQIQVMSLYEKHKKIYIRSVKGLWSSWRWILVWVTQLLFYGVPWIQWNDRQAVLFHLVERKFYLFGLVFWPQDVFYLAILLIISAYSLFLFSAVAGRLFCGYACPQTVYTEIFTWMENLVEGSRLDRIKLDKGLITPRKIRLKAIKHVLWILFSLWTGFTLVSYFTPVHELIANMPWGWGGWEILWILLYGGFTYLMAGYMREQVCKYMCPYARFQSVMFDPDTLVITYDQKRGEPRSIRRKNVNTKRGDCVDCDICVQACPVGIDIRKGLQYECIGCGVCIDACDTVMDKLKTPRGLIRYTSENALAGKYGDSHGVWGHVFRPRIIVYGLILALIGLAFIWSVSTRIPLRADVIRDRFVLAREVEQGKIENTFILKVMNVFESPRTFVIDATGLDGLELASGNRLEVGAAENREITLNVRIPAGTASVGSHPIYIEVVAEDDANVRVREKTKFIVP